MTIEEAIRQKKPFRNEYQRVTVNLLYTSAFVREQIKKQLKPFNITLQQYNVLRILNGAGKPLSTSDIRDRLLDKMSDTSRMVDRLLEKELVVRKLCPADKRLVDISLSRKGKALMKKISAIDEKLDAIPSNLTPEEARQLNDLLDKLRG
ncbi:MAG: MarR family transcriptional regulator [Bacteroidetes bacterium]|nr:MAG: MarR family transcriptional regulator [Bacteroidota bacterium]